MKIPVYNDQIEKKSASPLSVPELSTPPQGAFGGGVAQEQGRLGKVISGLGDELGRHVFEKQRQDQTNQIIAADTAAKQDLQNVLYDPTPDDNGIPKGILARKLSQANGATIDFDTKFKELRESHMSQFTNPVQIEKFNQLMDQTYSNYRDNVIGHEAKQINDNNKNILDSNLTQRVSDAGSIQDPLKLKTEINTGNAILYSSLKDLGLDDNSISLKMDDYTKDMVLSSLKYPLQTDPNKAQYIYSGIKDTIPMGIRSDIEREIDVSTRHFLEMQKFQREQQYDASMREAMLNMMDGKLSLSEAQRLYRKDIIKESDYNLLERKMVSPDYELLRTFRYSDAPTFNAIRESQIDKSKTPGEILRDIAGGVADKKIVSDDAKYLIERTKDLPSDPIDNVVLSEASNIRDFGNRYFKNEFLGFEVNKDKKDNDIENLVSEFYKKVDKEKADPARINEIGKELISGFSKKRFPELNRFEDVPDVVVQVNSKVQQLLNPNKNRQSKIKPKYRLIKNDDKGSK